jgi:hypothetical protein
VNDRFVEQLKYVFVAAIVASQVMGSFPAFAAHPPPTTKDPAPPPVTPAELTLGGQVILRISSSAGGEDPQDRVDKITDRLTAILAHPDIRPADVVLYHPPGKSPVIYVLGRNLITVDPLSAKQSGIGNQMQTAITWAKRLQQILPFVDIRKPNEPEPTIPANPPLLITSELKKVGGSEGKIEWNGHLVALITVSPDSGKTPAEFADLINARLALALNVPADTPIDVTTETEQHTPGHPVEVMINSTRLMSATKALAKAVGLTSPMILAEIWAGNVQRSAESAEPSPDQLPAAIAGTPFKPTGKTNPASPTGKAPPTTGGPNSERPATQPARPAQQEPSTPSSVKPPATGQAPAPASSKFAPS